MLKSNTPGGVFFGYALAKDREKHPARDCRKLHRLLREPVKRAASTASRNCQAEYEPFFAHIGEAGWIIFWLQQITFVAGEERAATELHGRAPWGPSVLNTFIHSAKTGGAPLLNGSQEFRFYPADSAPGTRIETLHPLLFCTSEADLQG